MAKSTRVGDLHRVPVLRLRPTFVHRFYLDQNRLGQGGLKTGPDQHIPERWIGSSVEAINPAPIPSGGLSTLEDGRTLRDAIAGDPAYFLGDAIVRRHGPSFNVLVKLLDPGEPIVFHFHGSDEQVRTRPENFKGHKFGKDEAYFFLDAPKGPVPYTHVGLYENVTAADLASSVRRGREAALELSPSFYQHEGSGFFVPAAVPHRPGTALTLEIQQPSDVYTLLETHAAGVRMPGEQIHPGFASLDEAFGLIDLPLAKRVGRMSGFALSPTPVVVSEGGRIDDIFPLSVCRKFGGRRVTVSGRMEVREASPFVLWVWRGRGRVGDQVAMAGDEFFVTHAAAGEGVTLTSTSTNEPMVAFTFFPGE